MSQKCYNKSTWSCEALILLTRFCINQALFKTDPNQYVISKYNLSDTTICIQNILFPKLDKQFNIFGKLKNFSYRTKCAEVDNINLPLYEKDAQSYRITAIHPAYKTSENAKIHDFNNCEQTNSQVFKLSNFRLGQKFSVRNRFVLTEGRYLNRRTLLLQFLLEGSTEDNVDSEIGNDITIVISPSSVQNLEMVFSYYGRNEKWISTSSVQFSAQKLSHTWSVPDFTWSPVAKNYISFILPEKFHSELIIDSLTIEKRDVKPDLPYTMFYDGRIILEGVDKDFWWLNSNGSMTIKIIETNEVFTAADYIRIYVPVPWNDQHWCQIFVMYQDGNVRLLPMTPPGLDWIPFGSSVVVGETNPNNIRPHAPIRHINIHMQKFQIDLLYYDGNTASLFLSPEIFNTSITVSNIKFRNKSELPPLTFRSMYVNDGNADCDHVNVDGIYDVHVLSNWIEMTGNTFFFYRRCISKHNTQSPDYLLQIFK